MAAINYKINYRRSVKKDLRKLAKTDRVVIIEKILALAKNPRPIGYIKLQGGQNLYRIRHTDYRVIYQIDDDVLTILVVKVGHRKNVYN